MTTPSCKDSLQADFFFLNNVFFMMMLTQHSIQRTVGCNPYLFKVQNNKTINSQLEQDIFGVSVILLFSYVSVLERFPCTTCHDRKLKKIFPIATFSQIREWLELLTMFILLPVSSCSGDNSIHHLLPTCIGIPGIECQGKSHNGVMKRNDNPGEIVTL